MKVSDRGVRCCDRFRQASFHLETLAVDALQVSDELARELQFRGGDRAVRRDRVQHRDRLSG